VITDTMYPLERKMRWLARIGVADLIDVVSCSTALGVKKPDAAIYKDALTRARVAAPDAVFVGHSAEEIAGARAVGMRTVAVHGDRDARADESVGTLDGVLELSSLRAPAP
jgi:FMN phosphatase YigB (HAD superfamily)